VSAPTMTTGDYNAKLWRAVSDLRVAKAAWKAKDTPANRTALQAAKDALDEVFELRHLIPNPMDYHSGHR
jgi:hypothetical protein